MSFHSYVLTLTPSVNGFAELPATLVSELGYHLGTYFKRVGFINNIYIYKVCLVVGWPHPMQNPGYATTDVIRIILSNVLVNTRLWTCCFRGNPLECYGPGVLGRKIGTFIAHKSKILSFVVKLFS